MSAVMISYAWQEPEEADAAALLAGMLRAHGINVTFDQDHARETWIRSWMTDAVRAASKVICLCSTAYNARFLGECGAATSGVAREAHAIRERIDAEPSGRWLVPIGLVERLRRPPELDGRAYHILPAAIADLVCELAGRPVDHLDLGWQTCMLVAKARRDTTEPRWFDEEIARLLPSGIDGGSSPISRLGYAWARCGHTRPEQLRQLARAMIGVLEAHHLDATALRSFVRERLPRHGVPEVLAVVVLPDARGGVHVDSAHHITGRQPPVVSPIRGFAADLNALSGMVNRLADGAAARSPRRFVVRYHALTSHLAAFHATQGGRTIRDGERFAAVAVWPRDPDEQTDHAAGSACVVRAGDAGSWRSEADRHVDRELTVVVPEPCVAAFEGKGVPQVFPVAREHVGRAHDVLLLWTDEDLALEPDAVSPDWSP